MTEKLRWGLLSTAKINAALFKPLAKSKRNTLFAVASRSLENAQAYAAQHHIPRAHGSYEALLADPEVDVIYNSLPNHLHAEWSIKALAAGKHVLCEKPFALTLAEVDQMAEAAEKSAKILAEAFMYRTHPQTLKVKELLDNAVLGRILTIKGQFTFPLNRPGNYRLDPSLGGGALWDVGCYPVSYARAMLGLEPLQVFGWQVEGQSGVDEFFSGQMLFPGEIHAQFDCGFRGPLRASIEIVGESGSLAIPTPFHAGKKPEILLIRAGKTKTIEIKGQNLYLGEVEDLADAILLGKAPHISLADSRANVAAILALYKSAETGKPVHLKKE
ncbi:MAG: Gfo/Idh/MocA family oxidoreductase [Anaerolineales bacterium]|jgi:predicted dehydrogenase|nr:Gfo/Idh/MocA family oxidoreductase [Anaerolineales bacterium]